MNEEIQFVTTEAQRREVRMFSGIDPVADLGFVDIAETDSSKPLVAIVMPCDQTRVRTVNSRLDRCAECNTRVWVTPAIPPEARRVCVRCAPKVLAEGYDA